MRRGVGSFSYGPLREIQFKVLSLILFHIHHEAEKVAATKPLKSSSRRRRSACPIAAVQ
jgi:hypothetical protein